MQSEDGAGADGAGAGAEGGQQSAQGQQAAPAAVAEQRGPAAMDAGKKLSKRERKSKNRLNIAELKQLVARPDVVEVHDCNSTDPKLLVFLKAYRNSVGVPKHWLQKRKYLQVRFDPAFVLPC